MIGRRAASTLLAGLLATFASISGCRTIESAEAMASRKPIDLFDGSSFDHWTTPTGEPVPWVIADGAMEVVPGSGSIMTRRAFDDFTLHVEFNVSPSPAGARGQGRGNSGVYLQRRYEVQILDSWGLPAGLRDCGALYDFRAPDVNASRPAGQWQSFDITFHAPRFDRMRRAVAGDQEPIGADLVKVQNARITVIQNGVVIHRDVELTGKTGAGQPEGPDPGPILLQDHGHPVRFRNIRIRPWRGS